MKERKLKAKICGEKFQDTACTARLVPCDPYGRPTRKGEWRVCPNALADFTRDELGFYSRKPGARHKAVKVERPEGYAAKVRRHVEAAQPALFEEAEWKSLERRKKYRPTASDLRRGHD